MSVYDTFQQQKTAPPTPTPTPTEPPAKGFLGKVGDFFGNLFSSKEEKAPITKPEPAPPTPKSIYDTFKTTGTEKASTTTPKSVYDVFKAEKEAKVSPYFYAKTDERGGAIGRSEELDTSGRPLFGYRNPGDTSTTTDKTRIATTFDPRVPKPLTKEEYYNPRAEGLREQLHDALGIKPSEELDHAIALTVGGSNQPENLRAIPKEENRKAGTYEMFLASQLKEGKMSYFDAQIADAKNKGVKVPWIPGNEPRLSDQEVQKIKTAGGEVIESYKPTFTQKVADFMNKILPGEKPEEQKNPDIGTKIKVPFLNRVITVPQNAVNENVGGLIQWPERIFNDVQTIQKTLNAKTEEEKPDEFKATAGDFIKDMNTFKEDLVKNGMSETGANILGGVFGVSLGIIDIVPGMSIAKSMLSKAVAKTAVTPIEHIAAWEAAGRPATVKDAETTIKGLLVDLSNKTKGLSTPEASKTAANLNNMLKILRDKGIPDQTPKFVKAISDLNKLLDTDIQDLAKFNPESSSAPFVKPAGELPGYKVREGQPAPVGLSTQEVVPVGKEPVFEGFTDLSTKTLEKLKGRSTVSKQFIEDLSNASDLKQEERDVIRSTLSTYPEGKDVPVKEFADKVKAELLPLKTTKQINPRYENTSLSNDLRGNVKNYTESMYESLIKTSAGNVHFPPYDSNSTRAGTDATPNYFGHTRIEDMADNSTRRVIEVQSDLYQKGNLERESAQAREIKSNPMYAPETRKTFTNPKAHDFINKETEKRLKDVAKLEQYSNPTAHFRMVREEVKKAKGDGISKLQFPTGETAMKIERLDDSAQFVTNKGIVKPEDLKKGMKLTFGNVIGTTGNQFIVTDVLGDGKFKAIPEHFEEQLKTGKTASGFPFDIEGVKETFDISGKVDTNNPIYKFYEKDLGRYLKNNYDAKLITDKQGVKWYEVDIKPEHKGPVIAYKTPLFRKLSGPLADIKTIKELIFKDIPEKDVKLIFTDELMKGGTTGKYEVVRDVLKPIITLYEEKGKVEVRTAFHEAGHYIFDNFLSAPDKRAVLDLARKEISIADKVKYKITGYKGEDKILEEYVMDQFAKQKAEGAGFKGPLKSAFEKISDIIRNIISQIKKVLKRIDESFPQKGREGGYVNFGERRNEIENISSILKEVSENKTGVFNRTPRKIVDLPKEISDIVGDNEVNLSEFVIAKIKGLVKDIKGHQEITDSVFLSIPDTLSDPVKILSDTRTDGRTKYFFVETAQKHQIVVEVKRPESGKTEINTIYPLGDRTIKQLESNEAIQAVYDRTGGTLTPSSSLSQRELSGVSSDKETLPDINNKVKQYQNPVEEKIQKLTEESSFLEEAINQNPAKELAKYANKNGVLPEVLGSGIGHGIFKTQGDDIVTELGFEDSETARAAYENYRLQQKRLKSYKEEIQIMKYSLRENKALDKDMKKLSTILEKSYNATSKEISKIAAKTEDKPPESQQALRLRKELARRNLQVLIGTTYNTTSPLERDSPEHILKLTEQSYNMSLEEFEKMNEALSFQRTVSKYQTSVKKKVGMLDYIRTPDRILRKIGLPRTSELLRHSYENYLAELPLHIDLIKKWQSRVDPKANEDIFKFLDGENLKEHYSGKVHTKLAPNEMKVALEIKGYLKEWADRLGLPEDSKISHYITHIFGIGENEKEFDEDVAKIIEEQVPGSVYDPFLEKRLGRKGYLKDTWAALDAYVKRATRKANMDPVLDRLKSEEPRLELSQAKYIKRMADRINLRPTEIDTLIDNTVKTWLGYRFGQRPVARISRIARQIVYRYALGLNFGAAIKNLTQGINTYAKLGEKYTTLGYIKLFTRGSQKELEEAGILKQDIIQDKVLSATRKNLERVDKGLFYFFELAEKINRGAAYYGAKAKGINEGMNELEAMEYAKKIVRDTQFMFGSIDTPVAMNSDIAKLFTQFMTYGVKQTEFTVEMLKNKEWAGLFRYMIASTIIVYVLGKSLNLKPSDFIPGYSFLKFGVPPTLALPWEIVKATLNVPDKFGNSRTLMQKVTDTINTIPFPAGVQAKKTYGGIQAYMAQEPGSKIEQNSYNLIKALVMGSQNLVQKKEIIQKIYDNVQSLKDTGKTAEAKTIVNTLSDEDYSIYSKMLTADKARATKDMKLKMTPVYNSVQKLKNEGKTKEAQDKVNSLTDEEYKAYNLIKKQLNP